MLACTIVLLTACKRETMDDRICRQTREYTRTSCPKRMDEYTVLDSMAYSADGRTMSYYYSVSGKMDVDTLYTSAMKGLFDTSLLNNIRHNPGLNELKEHDVTFRYTYYSRTNGDVYMSFRYTPDQYMPMAR